MVTAMAELNDLEIWGADVGNACLESETQEKVVFEGGEKFGPLVGHLFQTVKALCGLKSSGKRWHDRLHDVLRDLGFTPSMAEEDIWMKDMGDHCECITICVDDLFTTSKNPKSVINALESNPINFKLK
jgi:hypothetical protein